MDQPDVLYHESNGIRMSGHSHSESGYTSYFEQVTLILHGAYPWGKAIGGTRLQTTRRTQQDVTPALAKNA